MNILTNAEATLKFFSYIGELRKDEYLTHIALHYGISNAEALAEVTNSETECLLDYLQGAHRIDALMRMRFYNLISF